MIVRFSFVSLVLSLAACNAVSPDGFTNHSEPTCEAATPDARPELPHEDGTCFALSEGVYPTSYQWCAQEHSAHPVPFACVDAPPGDSCVPFVGDGSGWYPDRFCCCDPQASEECSFYK